MWETELSQEIYAKLEISQEEAAKIEKATRDQHNSTKWFILHAGQITASVMKDACRANQANLAKSLIKKSCYKINSEVLPLIGDACMRMRPELPMLMLSLKSIKTFL